MAKSRIHSEGLLSATGMGLLDYGINEKSAISLAGKSLKNVSQ